MSLKSFFFPRKYRKVPLPPGIFEGTVDVHTHLLPGVDDGFQQVDDSIETIRLWSEAGVKGIIFTPHFMESYPRNYRPAIEQRFSSFCSYYKSLPKKKVGSKIGLALAAEYMVDDNFTFHEAEKYLTLGKDTGYVLTETSYADIHPQHTHLLYDLSLAGYQPVIAHPERYQYASERRYELWKHSGYLFQLNLLSLSGAYGEMACEKALVMLEEGMYDFVGSDVHNLQTFLSFSSAIRLTTPQIDALRKLLENNARLLG